MRLQHKSITFNPSGSDVEYVLATELGSNAEITSIHCDMTALHSAELRSASGGDPVAQVGNGYVPDVCFTIPVPVANLHLNVLDGADASIIYLVRNKPS